MPWLRFSDDRYLNLAQICTVQPAHWRDTPEGQQVECVEVRLAGAEAPLVVCGQDRALLLRALGSLERGASSASASASASAHKEEVGEAG
jgi:hypothetical protein